ncbi:intraflagellar transport protein 46 homolog isoform X2 [Hetaerina americana]|uniref:intraflagellar transport protein 46 homolog isoform X2 n=1 Tax=Hetaerina americana TaxID=62018 RepID=UPI003A7F26B2
MFDECIEISDAEEIDTPPSSEEASSNAVKISHFQGVRREVVSAKGSENPKMSSQRPQRPKDRFKGHAVSHLNDDDDDDEDEGSEEDYDDEDEDDDDEDDVIKSKIKGAYKAEDYDNLQVSPAIKELFQYITRYIPQTIEPEYKLQHFVPPFIPATGDVDAFITVPKPRVKLETKDDDGGMTLGLTVLDEPCAAQSDPALLALKLRAIAKQPIGEDTKKSIVVKKIDSSENSSKVIESWIKDIGDLHRNKALPTVHYKRPMPEVDALMQEWPAEFEEELKKLEIPAVDLEMGLDQYVDIICSLLDIPVYESRIESLHLLFVLYASIRDAQKSNNMMSNFQVPQGEQ